MINKRFVYILLAIALLLAVTIPMTVSAAHCTDNGGPGNSDFAAHVRAANGAGGHNEGDHRGWASCEENSANFGG